MGDLTVETDPTGTEVECWVTANVTPLLTILQSKVEMQSGIQTLRFIVEPTKEAELVEAIAIGLVAYRLRQRPRAFRAWLLALRGGSLPDRHKPLIRQFIGSAFGEPSKSKPLNHLYGFVAEHILTELLKVVDYGLGTPVHLEQHEWSVTDPGGDSVAVYHMETDLHFRIWESKATTGATVNPKTVVGEASSQLDLRAWEYLARWSTVAQRMDDENLATFFVQMPDLWSNGDPRAGAGVAIATHVTKPTDACFAGLVGKFNLPDCNKHGSLLLATDFAALAQSVRSLVWKGAAWSEH